MSVTLGNNGRLCNQIIRNIALHFIAEKHNLHTTYHNNESISKLGINLYCGDNKYSKTGVVRNHAYYHVLNADSIDYNVDLNHDYFQFQQATDDIFKYIRSDPVRNNVIKMNPFNERYNANNDVFIHLRLGDIAISNYHLGLEYYLKCLSQIEFNDLYVATDSADHEIIQGLKEKYPSMKMVIDDEIRTIQFGSTCKYVILSHGSFSAVIGYLSFFSEVYFYNKESRWCPIDLFLNKGWHEVL